MAISLIAATITGFVAAIGTAAVFSWAAFAISAGFALVSRALTPKPDLGAQMGGQSITTREAAQTRKIVYGRARIGGNIAYLESTGSDNKYLWLVITVAGHEIDAFESVWFNDQKVLDGTNYTAAWATPGNSSTSPYVSITFHKGDQTAADSALNSASTKWTNDHKLLDTAYMVVKLTHDRDKFSSGLPNISTIIRGKKVLNPNGGATAWSQNPALCIYDYLLDAKYGLGETTANILTASVNAAKIICDQAIPLTAGGNQPRYTMDGVIDTGSSLKSNIELMVGSMAGRLIYSGGQFEIHAGSYVAPAFTVDESQIIGEITVQTKQSRRSAFNGVKGVFLSEDDNYILADYPVQVSKTVAGSFVVGKRYQILVINNTDFTAIGASANTVGVDFTATGVGSGTGTASLFLAQDGQQIFLDMALPFTVNNVRAQRLAKIALLRSRQQEAITIPCNLSALRFKIGDNINVTNARLGYNAKVFEVVGYSMGFSSDGQMGVDVQAIETASSIWAWQSSDQDVFLGGGEVELYDGAVAKPPTSLAVTAITFLAADGTNNSSFQTTWTASVDAFVEKYVVEWRLASPANQPYFSQETKISPFRINNLESSKAYNVRVKAINELGVSSTYATVDRTSTIDTTPPAVPSSVAATGEFEQITISWVNPTVDDFSHVDVYRSTSSSGTYAFLEKSGGTTFTDTNLAVGVQRFYKLKAVDYTGNASTSFSAIVNATTTQVPVGGIADDAVDTAQIADLAVETNQLDNDAVTIAKIATSLQSTNYSSGSAGWKILKSGVVEFEQATIRGEVIAATGSIGGYTINSNSLFAGSGNTRVSLSTADGISLGSNTFNDAPFSVTRAGALKATSAIITGNITATDLTVTNATVTGVFAANNVPNMQNLNGVIAANQINAGTIAVNKLTGDVTELYPISLFPASSMGTTSTTTYQDFWIPTPDLNLSKRQKVTADFAFTLNNTTSTSYKIFFQYGLQIKSKSALGISVGTVTHVSNPLSQHQLVSIAGNQLEKLDNQGSVAKTNNASGGSNAAATVRAVWFDHDDNKTYVLTANLGNTFSTNDTMFFSASKFASAGTFVSPNLIGQSAMYVPAGIELKVTLPLSNTFGASTTATNLRPFVIPYTNMNNVTGTFNYFKGTMENVS